MDGCAIREDLIVDFLDLLMSIQILPFTDDLLPIAGELLAGRCRNDRLILPALPSRFEDTENATAAVLACLEREHASGMAALNGSRLLGFLISDLVIDAVWGRSAWAEAGGLRPGAWPKPRAGARSVRRAGSRLGGGRLLYPFRIDACYRSSIAPCLARLELRHRASLRPEVVRGARLGITPSPT